jgi:hypothetical protein
MRRVLRWLVLGFVTFTIIIVGVLAFWLYRPDLYIDPVNRRIMTAAGPRWGTFASLSPYPLQAGTPAGDVRSILERAGYHKTDAQGAWRYAGEIKQGGEVYIRGADRFPCNVTFYVILKFDTRENLTSARGTQQEHGCL